MKVLSLFDGMSCGMLAMLFIILLRCHKKIGFTEIAGAYVGGIIIPYMLMSLIRMFTMQGGNGALYLLVPLLAAWGSDTCALFAGMAFGKHKLAPVISPKKTIEGSVGGVVGATVLLVIYGIAVSSLTDTTLSVPLCIAVGIFGAILGQVGDLSFSIVPAEAHDGSLTLPFDQFRPEIHQGNGLVPVGIVETKHVPLPFLHISDYASPFTLPGRGEIHIVFHRQMGF